MIVKRLSFFVTISNFSFSSLRLSHTMMFLKIPSIFIFYTFIFAEAYGSGISGILENSIPTQNPVDINFSTRTAVPICQCSKNKLQNVLNDAINSTVLAMRPPSEQAVTVCKNIFTEKFGVWNHEKANCDKCDYSYMVAIKTRRNGCENLTTVCQGLLLHDCTIATIYECTQLGEGLWVTFQNGNTFDVICIKEAERYNNVLGMVFVVRLVINVTCCDKLSNTFPKFATYNFPVGQGIFEGFLISRNSSSCNIIWKPVYSVLASAILKMGSTFIEVKIAIPNDVDAVSQPFFGGTPFIDENCNVYGIAFRKTALLLGVLFEVPVAKEIESTCVIAIVTPSLNDCN